MEMSCMCTSCHQWFLHQLLNFCGKSCLRSISVLFTIVLPSQLICKEEKSIVIKWGFCLLMWCRYQDPMLSTAQQMLQDSRSKIELIRLQIIKVTQAGGSTAGSDGGGNQDSFTQGGQNPQSDHLKGLLRVKWVFFIYSGSVTHF